MKVRILGLCSIAGRAFQPGEVCDLPDDTAAELVRVGAAVLDGSPDPPPAAPAGPRKGG